MLMIAFSCRDVSEYVEVFHFLKSCRFHYMFRFVVLLFVLFASPCLWAKEKNKEVDNTKVLSVARNPMAYSGFSGGMMINVGYGYSGEYKLYDTNGVELGKYSPVGVPVGMGGAFRVGFGKFLRIGIEGYVSTMSFGGNGSYARTGWGGVLADFKYDIEKWSLFVGFTVGGGNQRHLNIINDEHDEFQVVRSSFRKTPFGAIAPFLGAEYALTKRVHLIMKFDYMVNITNVRSDFVSGPRFFFGFMFCH